MAAVRRKVGERGVYGACRRHHVIYSRGDERNVESGGFGRSIGKAGDSEPIEGAIDVFQSGGKVVVVGCTTLFDSCRQGVLQPLGASVYDVTQGAEESRDIA